MSTVDNGYQDTSIIVNGPPDANDYNAFHPVQELLYLTLIDAAAGEPFKKVICAIPLPPSKANTKIIPPPVHGVLAALEKYR